MAITSSVSYIGRNTYVRREEKTSKKHCERAEENPKQLAEKDIEKAGVSYEKTISDSVSTGLGFIQSMEKQISSTKFFVGTVSYGQTYGNSSDVSFVVNPKFLNDFSKRFREQQLANGREIVSQGWLCDDNGNWGGWTISRPTKQSSVLQDMTDRAEKIRQEKLEEDAKPEEIPESVESETSLEKESETVSGSVGVNVGKTARKIAAAKTKEQLRAVIAEIRGDMQEVKAGIEKGWCDETELDKVNSLMVMAQNRMGQVEDREATPEEENAFALASLM